MDEREFWVQIRRGLMTMLDAIERQYDLPRTAELHQKAAAEARFRLRRKNGTTRECASSLSIPDKESA